MPKSSSGIKRDLTPEIGGLASDRSRKNPRCPCCGRSGPAHLVQQNRYRTCLLGKKRHNICAVEKMARPWPLRKANSLMVQRDNEGNPKQLQSRQKVISVWPTDKIWFQSAHVAGNSEAKNLLSWLARKSDDMLALIKQNIQMAPWFLETRPQTA